MTEMGPERVSEIRARYAKRPPPGTKVWNDDRSYSVVSDEYPEILALCDALEAAWEELKRWKSGSA